jgi:hypothetical protein
MEKFVGLSMLAGNRRHSTRVYFTAEEGESADEFIETEETRQIAESSRKVFSGSRVAAVVSLLALLGLVAFVCIRHGDGQANANVQATIGKPTTPQELFESDKFASTMAAHTLRMGHVSAEKSRTQAKLASMLKSQLHEAVMQHNQQGSDDARVLQQTLPPAKQQLAYDLMAIMFDNRTQELGARILQSYSATPVGEDPVATHRRLQEEHREMIQSLAQDFFPRGLKGIQEKINQDALDDSLGGRRLLPQTVRNRIGPVRSGWVVGTGVGSIGVAVVGMILTALNVLDGSEPTFNVHIPKWVIGMMATIAGGLKAASCIVKDYDNTQNLVNANFHPAALRTFGFNLGLKLPGWLKCAIFTGIAGLVALIAFIMEIVDHVKKTAR